MKERPILFSAPMVRALLDGRKTQTRRPFDQRLMATWASQGWPVDDDRWPLCEYDDNPQGVYTRMPCPYGAPGDRLWVRETWAPMLVVGARCVVGYRADGDEPNASTAVDVDLDARCGAAADQARHFLDRGSWLPSVHMPRWASRITLEITEVRVQRLQEISTNDVMAEGISSCDGNCDDGGCVGWPLAAGKHYPTARAAFCALWESINGGGSWAANPWVWALTFKRVEEARQLAAKERGGG